MDFIVHGALISRHRIRDGLLLLAIFIGVGIRPLPPSIRLVLLGDVMLGRGVARSHAVEATYMIQDQGFLPDRASVEKATWDQALKELSSHIKRADLAMANLESPLTGSELDLYEQGDDLRYNLCAPAGGERALSAVGMDVLTLANNHIFDCDIRNKNGFLQENNGINETSRILQENDMTPVAAYHIAWKNVNGLPLAIVALDDVSSPLDVNAAIEVIRLARSSGGMVIVSIHWGEEYSSIPTRRQERIAQDMADAGALIIWGHHPHVLQKLTWIQGKEQPFRTLVAYSLGNALFDQVVPQDAKRSALLKVEINAYGILSLDAIPFIIDPNKGTVHKADEEVEAYILSRLGIEELLARD